MTRAPLPQRVAHEIVRATRRSGGATAAGSRSACDVTQFWQ